MSEMASHATFTAPSTLHSSTMPPPRPKYYSLTHPLTHSPTHSLTHSLLLTYLLTYARSPSLAYLLTWLTRSARSQKLSGTLLLAGKGERSSTRMQAEAGTSRTSPPPNG